MVLLAKDAQERVVSLLVDEGLADGALVDKAKEEAERTKQPVLPLLLSRKIVRDEAMSHATAIVMGVPYVSLKNVKIDQEVLLMLPLEVAERSMSVPLGEVNGQLVVAMLDVANIQNIDYLSTLTQKPIRAMMSSEAGIREVLLQYKGDFTSVKRAVKATKAEVAQKQASGEIKTIVQDSPISKALTTILEYAAKSKASI